MTTLTVTSKGQATLKKELLQHLGVKPGQRLEVEPLPGGQLTIRALRPKGTWDDVFGMLAGETEKVATIEEMNEASRRGWAGLK
ncbi:AbrB/MazE/SpoVT family DNA-binding domain-containing protein [Pseudaminobacter sp. 19-2017]|uniref:AbrB/MazE/SpoVT family DNA-binding domain-containing protein n=1 Tax=Pseudaminobacter soli (ex Zhang et al. 2022) TaxID=2831468 RepID=A0A942DWJ7_9HYPH|nr:AbrB/MazE/SpoVT family DNA-binding domain-containing protein [Pseudaminobacter soli]MBS3648421.1 AbrB/MazE/SpoVT family DNA-binding domain-containing protein [Pseudaminobacter soli]